MPFRTSLSSVVVSVAASLLLAAGVSTMPSFSNAQTEATAKENDPLTTYLGKNRVLLVFAPTQDDPLLVKQLSELQNKAELKERDLIVLPVPADDKAAGKSLPYLQTKFNGGRPSFALVLVGKDGNDAYQTAEPVEAKVIYAKIDAMPMRKDEVKEKKAASTNESGTSKTSTPEDN